MCPQSCVAGATQTLFSPPLLFCGAAKPREHALRTQACPAPGCLNNVVARGPGKGQGKAQRQRAGSREDGFVADHASKTQCAQLDPLPSLACTDSACTSRHSSRHCSWKEQVSGTTGGTRPAPVPQHASRPSTARHGGVITSDQGGKLPPRRTCACARVHARTHPSNGVETALNKSFRPSTHIPCKGRSP